MTSLTPPIKLVPPRADAVVARAGVDAAVAAALAKPQVRAVLLAAPPGSGKSTWAADFVRRRAPSSVWLRLDEADADPPAFFAWLAIGAERVGLIEPGALPRLSREHLADLPAFARVWLRAFSASLRQATLVVMDDLHTVLASPRLAPVLPVLLDEAGGSCRFLLLSRTGLPHAFARHRLNDTIADLDPSLLNFTPDEVAALLEARGMSAETAAALWQRTRGWPAATVAFAGQSARGPSRNAGSVPEALRDFIRAEVLAEATDRELERLAAMAALPYFRPTWSVCVSSDEARRNLVGKLAEHGWFVERFPGEDGTEVCRLHPLLAEAVEREASERLSPAQIGDHFVRCAELLRADSAHEAAARLFLRARAWDEAMIEIVALAPALLASARHLTLHELAGSVPADLRSAALWLALAQAELLFDPGRARACAVAVLERCRGPEEVGAEPREVRVRALAVITNSYFLEFSSTEPLSHWLDELRAAGALAHALDQPDLEATLAVSVWSGLFLRDPGHPDLGAWEQRVRAAIAAPGDPNVRLRGAMLLAKHYWYTGQYVKIPSLRAQAALHLSDPGLLPYARLVWYLFLQYDCWARADLDEGRRVTAEALALSQACGIHLLDNHLRLHGASFALLQRDEAAAADLLAAVEAASSAARRMEVWHHFTCRSWFANTRGESAQAIEYARVALEAADAMGPSPACMTLAALAHAQLRLDDTAAVTGSIERLRALASVAENPLARLHIGLLEAELARRRGAAEAGDAALRSALAIVQAQRLVCFPGSHRDVLRLQCARAFSAGFDVDLAKQLVCKWGIAAEPPPTAVESWPWPVKIFTLGRFSVLVNDAPVPSQGRTQRKSWELLQALIAFGGREVAESTLAQALWPDSHGDAAHHALEVSLHRLRKLIGRHAVTVQGGRLSLDAQCCWVDVWALERAFAGLAGALVDRAGAGEIDSLIARVQSLYRGPFLGHDSQPWLLAARERLRSRYLRALDAATARLEHVGKWPEMIELLVKGLDVDPFTESFYRRVMLGYQRLGRPAEALSAWRRCQRTLSAGLGISPSAETEAIARQLQQQ